MIRNREISATHQIRHYPNDAINVCVLCGNDLGSIYFRGKLICEECLDVIREMH
jgi:hypothetical protein